MFKTGCDLVDLVLEQLLRKNPYWVKIIRDTLKEDSIDNQTEIKESVTRNFVNRIGNINLMKNA